MEKGLLFLTLAVGCLWLILDEFFGDKRLSNIVNNVTPDFENPLKEAVHNAMYGKQTLEEKVEAKEALKDKVDKEFKSTDKAKSEIKKSIDMFWEMQGVGST